MTQRRRGRLTRAFSRAPTTPAGTRRPRAAGRLLAGAGLVAGVLVTAAAPVASVAVSAATARSSFSRIVPCAASRAAGGVHGLISAINGANAAGGGSIRLAGGCVYRLTSVYGNTALGPNGPDGLPPITTPIVLYGRSATIQRQSSAHAVRILEVNGTGSLNARRLSLVNGSDVSGSGGGAIYNEGHLSFFKVNLFANSSSAAGGGLYNAPGGVVTWNEGSVATNSSRNPARGQGGGIYSDSRLSLMDTSISNNGATAGGGVFNDASGTLDMNGDVVSGNDAEFGGGIETLAAANLTGVTVAGNDADTFGGGVDNPFTTSVTKPLTISGGTISANDALIGGGIYTGSDAASLVDVDVTGNAATGSEGGGILNINRLAMRGVRLTGNRTAEDGGGLFNSATLSVTGGRIAGNTVTSSFGFGGGILNDGTVSSLTDVSISGNAAPAGAGLYNVGHVATLATSTFSANTASGAGGGLFNLGSIASAYDLTFTGNTAAVTGGAIGNSLTAAISSLRVSTFSGDSAPGGGEIWNTGSLTVAGSIFAAGSSGGDCAISGTFNDSGFNLGSDGTCPFSAGTSNASSTIATFLAPLANNGGPTETVALEAGANPAIGGITSPCSSVDGGYGFDQRGVPRPATCDIGSFQTIPTKTVVSASSTSVASGTKINLYATVTPGSTLDGAATGTAAFFLNGGSSPIGIGTLRGGNPNLAIFTVALPAGTNVITAKYLGATGFSPSTSSNSVTVTVH